MPNLNAVQLMGNLTRDPETRYLPNGTAVTQLGLAINRTWTNDAGEKQEETTFVDVELFGRIAEIAGEYLKKGKPVFIGGRLKLDSWTDKTTGDKRSKMKVVGEQLQLLGDNRDRDEAPRGGSVRGRDAQQQRSPESGRPIEKSRRPAAKPGRPPVDPDLDQDGDDIPF